MDIVTLFRSIDGQHVTLNMEMGGFSADMEIPVLCINVDGGFMWGNNVLSLDWDRKWDITETEPGVFELSAEGMKGIITVVT